MEVVAGNPLKPFVPNTTRNRKRAYLVAKQGAIYHQERLKHLILGLQRGSSKDLEYCVKRFLRWARRYTGRPIDYRATWVIDFKDGIPRQHVHILTNMEFIPQSLLLRKFEGYTGEPAKVFIRDLGNDPIQRQRALRYVMQYTSMQKGEKIRYSQSRHWLPWGCDEHWRQVKKEIRDEMGDGVFSSPEWRDAAKNAQETWIKGRRESVERRKEWKP